MFVRDTSSNDDAYYTYYSPWWNWGRWVLLAVVIVFVVATALSFVAKKKQLQHRHQQPDPNIPLGPIYPQDPAMQNPPPPKYEPQGEPYNGPVWTSPQQQNVGEKGYASQYGPPPGPPPAAAGAGVASSSFR